MRARSDRCCCCGLNGSSAAAEAEGRTAHQVGVLQGEERAAMAAEWWVEGLVTQAEDLAAASAVRRCS